MPISLPPSVQLLLIGLSGLLAVDLSQLLSDAVVLFLAVFATVYMWFIFEAMGVVLSLVRQVALSSEWRMVSWLFYWSIFMAIVPSMLIFISIPNSSYSELLVFCSKASNDTVWIGSLLHFCLEIMSKESASSKYPTALG